MPDNHLADPGGGGSSTYDDLKVSNSDLAEIGKEAHSLHDQLWNKGRVAQSTSESVAGDLTKQGFTLGKGLQHVTQRWDDQLTSLLDACAQISNHMHLTQKIHSGNDGHIANVLSSIDTLDAGFDDREGRAARQGGQGRLARRELRCLQRVHRQDRRRVRGRHQGSDLGP
ncbi:hypothetical protein AB0D11_20105 [Streptomyces monashensis]